MKDRKISLRAGEAVPFVITKTTLQNQPTIKRSSHFIGPIAGLKRLVYGLGIKVIDAMEEAFFEKDVEVDEVVLDKKHYAVFVTNGSSGPFLDVQEIPWKPAAGHHYEMVRVQTEDEKIVFEGDQKTEISRTNEETEVTRIQLMRRLGLDSTEPKADLTKSLPTPLNGTSVTQS